MLPSSVGRQNRSSLNISAGRWTEWVSSLIDRYSSTHLRYGMPTMILVRRGAPVYMFSPILEHHVWRFYPKIDLKIGPVLQIIGVNWTGIKEATAKGTPTAELSYLSDTSPKDRGQIKKEDYSAHEKTQPLSTPYNIRQSAIRRVFARVNQPYKLNLFSESLAEGERNQILRRLVQQRRRIEEVIYRDTDGTHALSTKPKMPEMNLVRSKKNFNSFGTELNEIEFPVRPRDSVRLGTHTIPQTQINVEQLTEQVIRQIDHRIRAYRERRGKVF